MPEITKTELSWMRSKRRDKRIHLHPAVAEAIMFVGQVALMSAAFGVIMLLIAVLN